MTRNAPFVTVLITTYNYGHFIEQAIDSVIAQDYPADKIQILVVDDGSTDDTSERVKKYGSRISYFQKPNGGQASALNFGFAKARGEIVALLDADDLFVPFKLTRISEVFQHDPTLGMIYHRTRMWKAATDEYSDYEFLAISGDLKKEPDRFAFYIPQPTTCVCFRRTAVEPLLPVPENVRMNADCFLVALIPFVAPVLALPEFLSVYRVHGENAFYLDCEEVPLEVRKKRAITWQTVTDEMRKWLVAQGYTREYRPVRFFFDRWDVLVERETFALESPGRIRYFQHLLKSYRYRPPVVTWRFFVANYMNACLALLVGYKRFPQCKRRSEGFTRWVRSLSSKKPSAILERK